MFGVRHKIFQIKIYTRLGGLKDTVRLGLNIPLFVASMIAIAIGTFTGMAGIWGYAVQRLVIPTS